MGRWQYIVPKAPVPGTSGQREEMCFCIRKKLGGPVDQLTADAEESADADVVCEEPGLYLPYRYPQKKVP
jgi:hypothetical protein